MSSAASTPRSPRGEAVYFLSQDESWQLGRRGIDGGVRGENGKVHKNIKTEDIYVIMDEKGLNDETEDLLKLSELHEGALLRCVKMRHAKDEIYTFIGPSVVLSLNPWKYTIPAYTPDKIPLYVQGAPNLPPHIWNIGKSALDAMRDQQQDQTILVSGESGAGKTEVVKSLLKFLSAASSVGGGDGGNGLQEKIEACNPILETFGNAKTVRNDNSSRFGKFLQVMYNAEGGIIGAHTTSYLLERSRVISSGKQERVFHSFYQLLASPEAKAYDLDPPTNYPQCAGVVNIDGVDDAASYQETCEAMATIGMSPDEVAATWRTVAGILHLQRIEFDVDPATDETVIAYGTETYLEKCASMWRVDADNLQKELMTLTTRAGNETVVRKHSVNKATATRDAVCKEVYASVFKWLIDKINQTMKPTETPVSWIGLLDIFGFEHFQVNSLEQLCINLANEILQNHYNEHIFTADISECLAEGIETQHVEYQDNAAVVSLIGDSATGILAHLDDQCKTRPEDNDTFLDTITEKFSSHAAFHRSRLDRDAFRLHHYAAEVRYCVDNFGEKNLDSVQEGAVDVIRASQDPLVSSFLNADTVTGTVTGIFKKQLKDLLDMINATRPSWIRCIKPHPVKRPKLFDPVTTMAQLASSGVLETVRVRKLGYPVRLTHQVFVDRFKMLLPPVLRKADPKVAATSLLDRLNLSKEKAQIGHNKVFLRSFTHTELEERRTGARELFINTVRKWGVTALAMQDAYARRHKGLLEALKKQREERTALEAECEEEMDSVVREEGVERATLSADILPSMMEACVAQSDRMATIIMEEEEEGHTELVEYGEMLQKLQDEGQLLLVERALDAVVNELTMEEDEEWGRLALTCEEEGLTVGVHIPERLALQAALDTAQREVTEDAELYERALVELEETGEWEYLLLLCEEGDAYWRDLVAEEVAIFGEILEAKLATVEAAELREREVETLDEEAEREGLLLLEEEGAGAAEILGYVRWMQRESCEVVEGEGRGLICDEEEGYFQVLMESEVQSHSRAMTLEHHRVQNIFQSDEHICRARIEEEYERSLQTLHLHKTVVKVKLYAQYLNELEMKETDRRAEIGQQYDAFCTTIKLAWTTNYYQSRLLEVEARCYQSRKALELLHDESRQQLITLFLKGASQVAAVERHNELQHILTELDDVQANLHSQSPPRYHSVTPMPGPDMTMTGSPQARPRMHSTTPTPAPYALSQSRPRRTMSRSPSPNKRLQLPAPPALDPFTSGTWLWRATVPSVSRRWTRVFVKLIDGALHWCTSETSEPKIFKLSRVISVDQHDLPDRDGYKSPDASCPTVAQRYSSTAQHAALRLGLRTEVEGSTSGRAKSILLCAEFPSVAVMWLRRLRQEWSKVCKTELHPHGSPERTCTPGTHGSLNISPLLASSDDNAVELVRELRKWMRKAKKAGFDVSANTDLRTFTSKPEGSVSPSHCNNAVCGFSRRAIARQCDSGHNILTPPAPGQWDAPGGDGDSDLSEDVNIDELLDVQRKELLSETQPTETYVRGTKQENEWKDMWKRAFGFAVSVPRQVLMDACMKNGVIMKHLARSTVYNTVATDVISEVLMRRVFLEEGNDRIERDEFITWCTGGGEELTPCYVAMVRSHSFASVLAAAMVVAATGTPSPSLPMYIEARVPSPAPKACEEIDASSPITLPSMSPHRSEKSEVSMQRDAVSDVPPVQQPRAPPQPQQPQVSPPPPQAPVDEPPQAPPPQAPQQAEPHAPTEEPHQQAPAEPTQEPAPPAQSDAAPSPPEPIPPSGAAPPAAEWECELCMYTNDAGLAVCDGCGEPSPS